MVLHPLPTPIWAGVFCSYAVKTWVVCEPWEAESTSACWGPLGGLKWGCRWPHFAFLLLSRFLCAASLALAQPSGVFDSAAGEKTSSVPPQTALRANKGASAVGTHWHWEMIFEVVFWELSHGPRSMSASLIGKRTWVERERGQRRQSEFWSGRCRTSCKICKQLLQAISSGLIMGQALFQGFPSTSSFQTHNNMRRWVQSIPPFYRWANWGYGRLSNRPKVTQHILEPLGLGPRAHITTVLDWQMESGTFFFF